VRCLEGEYFKRLKIENKLRTDKVLYTENNSSRLWIIYEDKEQNSNFHIRFNVYNIGAVVSYLF